MAQQKDIKGCIVLQRQFAQVGNAIALELKNRYGIKQFCGFVQTRRALSFVNSQKDISYTRLLLDEDLHNQYKNEKLDIKYLKELETKYGLPNLWPYIATDRVLMMNIPKKEYSISPVPPYTHEEMLRILQVKFREIIKFLEKERPDFIIGVNVGSIGAMVLYHVTEKMGIKNYTVEVGKIGNRVTFTNDYRTLTGMEKIFRDIKERGYKSPFREEAESFLDNFRRKPEPPSFAAEEKEKGRLEKILLIPFKFFRALKFTLNSTIKYLLNPNKSDTTVENPGRALLNKMRRKIRGFRNLASLYDKPDFAEEFGYFPLHFEPEITTLLYAPFYTNQINLISQIARSLPVNFKIYIKEHPSMIEYRPTEYYRELKKIPNLRLIDPKVSSFDLIENSKIVLTITGTAGFEAALLKKPVITFGDVFYNNLSMVKRNGAIEKLPDLIRQELTAFRYDNEEVIDFLSAVFEDTVPFDFSSLWSKGSYEDIKTNKDLPVFVELLAKKLGVNG